MAHDTATTPVLDVPVEGPAGTTPAMSTPEVDRVVGLARRRMRTNRWLARVGRLGVAVLGLLVMALVVGRFVVLPVRDPWLAVAAVGVLLVGAGVGALGRITDQHAAWAADRWFDTREALTTALELRDGPRVGLPEDVRRAQVAAAEQRAAGLDALPTAVVLDRRTYGIAAGLLAVAALLAVLPNPSDDVREQRAREAAVVEAVADDLRDEAERLRERDDPESLALSEDIEALADRLAEEELDDALESLAEERAELGAELQDDLASARTGLTGLAQDLARDSLASGDTVREQLEQLAQDAEDGELTDEERADLSERLEELSDALASSQPEISQGLRDAGNGLESGAASDAARGLRDAAEAVGDAVRDVSRQETLERADGALAEAQDALRQGSQPGEGQQADEQQDQGQQGDGEGQEQQPGQGEGQGQQAGQGEGQGQQDEGQGQQQGQGEGQQQGQGAGEGGGGGGGNPTGDQGQGGQNTGGEPNTGGDATPDLETVYDPPGAIDAEGEDVRITGDDTGRGDDQQVGDFEGEGQRNEALVPYADVLGEYEEAATDAIERGGFPTRLRGVVRDYFDTISAR